MGQENSISAKKDFFEYKNKLITLKYQNLFLNFYML